MAINSCKSIQRSEISNIWMSEIWFLENSSLKDWIKMICFQCWTIWRAAVTSCSLLYNSAGKPRGSNEMQVSLHEHILIWPFVVLFNVYIVNHLKPQRTREQNTLSSAFIKCWSPFRTVFMSWTNLLWTSSTDSTNKVGIWCGRETKRAERQSS